MMLHPKANEGLVQKKGAPSLGKPKSRDTKCPALLICKLPRNMPVWRSTPCLPDTVRLNGAPTLAELETKAILLTLSFGGCISLMHFRWRHAPDAAVSMHPAQFSKPTLIAWECVMPSLERPQSKTAKRQATLGPKSKPMRRMVRFEEERWYAEAARKMSAAKKPADQRDHSVTS